MIPSKSKTPNAVKQPRPAEASKVKPADPTPVQDLHGKGQLQNGVKQPGPAQTPNVAKGENPPTQDLSGKGQLQNGVKQPGPAETPNVAKGENTATQDHTAKTSDFNKEGLKLAMQNKDFEQRNQYLIRKTKELNDSISKHDQDVADTLTTEGVTVRALSESLTTALERSMRSEMMVSNINVEFEDFAKKVKAEETKLNNQIALQIQQNADQKARMNEDTARFVTANQEHAAQLARIQETAKKSDESQKVTQNATEATVQTLKMEKQDIEAKFKAKNLEANNLAMDLKTANLMKVTLQAEMEKAVEKAATLDHRLKDAEGKRTRTKNETAEHIKKQNEDALLIKTANTKYRTLEEEIRSERDQAKKTLQQSNQDHQQKNKDLTEQFDKEKKRLQGENKKLLEQVASYKTSAGSSTTDDMSDMHGMILSSLPDDMDIDDTVTRDHIVESVLRSICGM
jgi:chromosome segregation ATPase